MRKPTDFAVLLLLPLTLSSSLGCRADPDAVQPTEGVAEPELGAPLDNTWVSVSGTVTDTMLNSFILDYGSGTIRVEFEEADWFPGGTELLENDEVVVYGYVDEGFYQDREIDARSVYVHDLGTQFYAEGVDEDAFPLASMADFRPRIEMRGTVQSVGGDEFMLDTGVGVIEVETDEMGYDPLDEEGFQRITPGDRVAVTGSLDPDLFSEMDLIADTIVSLKTRAKTES